MSGPSQPKVVDEDWNDERVGSFLQRMPRDGTDPDFHVLVEAYRHMTPELFERFLDQFQAAGRNLRCKDRSGQEFKSRLAGHRRAEAYLAALKVRLDQAPPSAP